MSTGVTVRTNMRNALVACIKEITKQNGYRNDINDVFDPPIGIEKMTQFPCINIYYGEERTETTDLAGNNPLLNLLLNIEIDVFFQAVNDPEKQLDDVIGDFQEYFGKNYYIQPQGGQRTVFEILYKGSIPYGTEVNEPNMGVRLSFEIRYTIRRADPTVMV